MPRSADRVTATWDVDTDFNSTIEVGADTDNDISIKLPDDRNLHFMDLAGAMKLHTTLGDVIEYVTERQGQQDE